MENRGKQPSFRTEKKGDGRWKNNVWGRKLTKIYRPFLCFCPQIRREGKGDGIMPVLWKRRRELLTMQSAACRERPFRTIYSRHK
jgi:hypothetical protein